jgi:DNA-binding IclR family transcriptional regulator
MELRDRAKPFLVRLAQRTGLTVHMAVLERNQAVLIEKLETLGTPPIGTWVGRVMDMHSTAVGKALIAYLSPEDFLRQIKADIFVRHNRNTILTISQLRQELAEVRELGYAVDNEEDEVGSRCVGAPVLNGDGRVVAAISIVGTTTQFPEELIYSLGKFVKQTAATMSSRL